jgi:hypothetical protein
MQPRAKHVSPLKPVRTERRTSSLWSTTRPVKWLTSNDFTRRALYPAHRRVAVPSSGRLEFESHAVVREARFAFEASLHRVQDFVRVVHDATG